MTMAEPAGQSPGRRIGEEPKPRALLSWNGPDHDRVAEVLALHAPTVRLIERLIDVRQTDFDLLVTNRMSEFAAAAAEYQREAMEPANHLCVITFGGPDDDGDQWGVCDVFRSPGFLAVDWRAPYLAQAVVIPDDVLPAALDLVNDDLVPAVRRRRYHSTFHTRGWSYSDATADLDLPDLEAIAAVAARQAVAGVAVDRPARPDPEPGLYAFLRTDTEDRRVLAGWYRRSEFSEGWALPADVRRPWDWVAAAVRHWAITYGRFPLVGGWWEAQKWQTRPEVEASATRTRLKEELAATTARLEAEIDAAAGVLDAAVRDAAIGPRRLLTEKGDPLKEAAAWAFGQLGYAVTDRDAEELPDTGGRIEDLGVADPDDSGFDPIVEVKGYDSGARAGDFGAMVRHQVRAIAAGRTPTAIWWVANTWRQRPPEGRLVVLAGEEPMIAEHAGEDVPLVVIDTRDLFRAVRAVEDGLVTSTEVRASLRAARGRWEGIARARMGE
jgi:hypothetical protein